MDKTLSAEYEKDYYAWLGRNAELLRRGQLAAIDAENIAEELEYMGKRERRELISRLTILLFHLLKWQYQPARRSKSWRNTLLIQRSDLSELVADSPSLRADIETTIERAYERAILLAEDETGLERSQFPPTCPYSYVEIIEPAFFPGDKADHKQSED